jgi:hypothetical protein
MRENLIRRLSHIERLFTRTGLFCSANTIREAINIIGSLPVTPGQEACGGTGKKKAKG